MMTLIPYTLNDGESVGKEGETWRKNKLWLQNIREWTAIGSVEQLFRLAAHGDEYDAQPSGLLSNWKKKKNFNIESVSPCIDKR